MMTGRPRFGPNRRKRVHAGTRPRVKRDDVVCNRDVTRNCREQREARGCSRVRHVDLNPGSDRIPGIRDPRFAIRIEGSWPVVEEALDSRTSWNRKRLDRYLGCS